MGFAILKSEDGRSCPVLICDRCGKRIDDWDEGMAILSPKPLAAGETAPVLIVHKRMKGHLCDPNRHEPWHELRDHFLWTLINQIVMKQGAKPHWFVSMKPDTEDQGLPETFLTVKVREPML